MITQFAHFCMRQGSKNILNNVRDKCFLHTLEFMYFKKQKGTGTLYTVNVKINFGVLNYLLYMTLYITPIKLRIRKLT